MSQDGNERLTATYNKPRAAVVVVARGVKSQTVKFKMTDSRWKSVDNDGDLLS